MTVLSDIFDQNPLLFPEYESLRFEERSFTNRQIYRRISSIGHGLMSLGMEPGDVLLLHMENHPDVPCLVGACSKTGIILCPTMFLLSAEELSWIAEHSEAKYVVTTPDLLPKVRLACPRIFDSGAVIVAGEERIPGTIILDDLCAGQPDTLDTNPELVDDDVAVLIYTSGTTGRPKGVLLTHRNLGSNINSVAVSNQVTRDEVALSALPLSHSYGLTMALLPFKIGLVSVLMRWFDAEKVFEYTEKYRINTMTGVPAMYIHLLNHPRAPQYNVRSWKRLQTGAAPLPEEVLIAFREKFKVYLYEGYGLTEASPVVSCQRPQLPVKVGSVGPAIEGVEIRIRDDYERELPVGSPGEITVRGPNVMKGYFKDPEETERVLRGGWLHTGDVGYIDEDGYIFIVERKKDLIITGGFNLYPSEVEQVLMRHPAVKEAVVVGEPDPILGELVHGFVILNEGQRITEMALIEFTKKSLIYYKCPHRITFVDEIPRTFLGKPSRRDLKNYFLKK